MSQPFVEIPASPNTVLGLDMDLTITADRGFFARLSTEVKANGGRVVVIAARSPKVIAPLWQELDQAGVKCDEAHCLPEVPDAVADCPHREHIGWYKSYLWHKARIAQESEVTHYVDDEPVVHELFRQLLPRVKIYYPWELCPRIGNETEIPDAKVYQRYAEAWSHTAPDRDVSDSSGLPREGSYTEGVTDPVAYAISAEGEFGGVIAALGGRIVCPSPQYLTGNWIVVLPASIELHVGDLSAGGCACRFIDVHKF